MSETCQTCQGNGEIVTDWDRYLHPHKGDVGDEAVAECSDCDGYGTVDTTPRCPKCSEAHGDHWRQCGGSCPVVGSPHYNPQAEGAPWRPAALQ